MHIFQGFLVNLKRNKKCIYEGCKIRASFNVEGEKTPKFCSKHKLENMYDLKHYLCLFKDCKTRASCNYEGKKVPSFCSEHRLQGMINVVSTRCKSIFLSLKKKERTKNIFITSTLSKIFEDRIKMTVIAYIATSIYSQTLPYLATIKQKKPQSQPLSKKIILIMIFKQTKKLSMVVQKGALIYY